MRKIHKNYEYSTFQTEGCDKIYLRVISQDGVNCRIQRNTSEGWQTIKEMEGLWSSERWANDFAENYMDLQKRVDTEMKGWRE